jgi:hypothetical protein
MNWAALILAIAKAIPAFKDMYLESIDLYYAQIDAADQSGVSKNAKKRDALLAALKSKELTDEQRNTLRRALYDTSRN